MKGIAWLAAGGALLLLLIGLLLYLAHAVWVPEPGGSAAPTLAVRNVTVVDADAGESAPSQTVLITNGLFAAVGPVSEVAIPEGTAIVDGSGHHIIPALWDMHVHLGAPTAAHFDAPLMVANGVLRVRDMAGDCVGEACTYTRSLDEMRELRRSIAEDDLLGPHVMSSGSFLIHGPMGADDAADPSFLAPATAQEGARLARHLQSRGVDFAKPYDSMPRAAYFGMLEEAGKLGLSVEGHVPGGVTLAEAIAAGQRSIEHARDLTNDCSRDAGSFRTDYERWAASNHLGIEEPEIDDWYEGILQSFDEERCATLLNQWAESDTYYVPTHLTRHAEAVVADQPYEDDPRARYVPELVREIAWSESAAYYHERFRQSPGLRTAYADYFRQGLKLTGRAQMAGIDAASHAGVKIMAGTDSGDMLIYPGFSLHEELALFVEAGMTPAEALRSATITPARFYGRGDELGSIEPGKVAEFVLLGGDPLADIENSSRILAVYHNGQLYERDDLDAILGQVESKASGLRQYVVLGWFLVTELLPSMLFD